MVPNAATATRHLLKGAWLDADRALRLNHAAVPLWSRSFRKCTLQCLLPWPSALDWPAAAGGQQQHMTPPSSTIPKKSLLAAGVRSVSDVLACTCDGHVPFHLTCPVLLWPPGRTKEQGRRRRSVCTSRILSAPGPSPVRITPCEIVSRQPRDKSDPTQVVMSILPLYSLGPGRREQEPPKRAPGPTLQG